MNGDKELLGLWIEKDDGAKFCATVACRMSSSPAVMGSPAFLMLSKRSTELDPIVWTIEVWN